MLWRIQLHQSRVVAPDLHKMVAQKGCSSGGCGDKHLPASITASWFFNLTLHMLSLHVRCYV
jgi:hypothetical protein